MFKLVVNIVGKENPTQSPCREILVDGEFELMMPGDLPGIGHHICIDDDVIIIIVTVYHDYTYNKQLECVCHVGDTVHGLIEAEDDVDAIEGIIKLLTDLGFK